MFNIIEYKDYLHSLVKDRAYLRNKDITDTLLNALLVFDTPVSVVLKDVMSKRTIYEKYQILFKLTNKPKGRHLNLWLLQQYGYKYCASCANVKALLEFGSDAHTPDFKNRNCRECVNATTNTWKKENRQVVNNYQKAYYYANLEKMRDKSAKWGRLHKDAVAANSALKRANRRKATPSWLTDSQRQEICWFYKEAKRLERETGIKHHVDHIVPISNHAVCGLHVPWNLQVLTAEDNMKKSNKFFEDYII